jgi:MFS family permease
VSQKTTESEEQAEARVSAPTTEAQMRGREAAVASMVTASLMAVAGTLIFAWALRAPDYPWLFAVGALPWVVGVILFGRALWKYTRL